MGSSASAHTYVETETPNFKAGERVTGVIKIYVEEAVIVTDLHLLLIGKEKTRWLERTRRNHTTTVKGDRKLLEKSFPIWNFEGYLDKGQYTIPFGVQLPNWLPPSFRYMESYVKGEVLYKLKAVVYDSDKFKAHKNVIWIKSLPNPTHPINKVSGQETFMVSNCCCFSAGVTEASAHIPRNVATFEDNINVSILVNNTKGRQTVTGITCILVRFLLLKNDDSYLTYEHIMVEAGERVEIKPGESILPDKYHTIGLPFNETRELLYTPTTKSILIDCEYSIDIVLTFDNFCGGDDYRIRLPIDLFNGDVIPGVQLTPQPEMPIQWNPVALATAPIERHEEVDAPEHYFRERQEIHS